MITLYSNSASPESHRTRIVLAEKELPGNIIEVDPDSPPPEITEYNLAGKLPMITDRSATLYNASVINEYLDERYPHPPLKPASPAQRAQMRLAVLRTEEVLYPLYFNLESAKKKAEKVAARAKLCEYLEVMDSYFARQEWFIEDSYTLADITVAPILWRLSPYDVDTKPWPHLEAYMDRLFERPAFDRALSEHEQMLHEM